MEQKQVMQSLANIQQAFKAKKDKYNQFAQFYYRSAESMFSDLKPLLRTEQCVLTFSEEPIAVGQQVYLKCTARITSLIDGSYIENTSCARDCDERKGLSWAQGSGCVISYERKYTLQGLLLVDDGNDDDTAGMTQLRNGGNQQPKKDRRSMTKDEKIQEIVDEVNSCMDVSALSAVWSRIGKWTEEPAVKAAFTNRKVQLQNG